MAKIVLKFCQNCKILPDRVTLSVGGISRQIISRSPIRCRDIPPRRSARSFIPTKLTHFKTLKNIFRVAKTSLPSDGYLIYYCLPLGKPFH